MPAYMLRVERDGARSEAISGGACCEIDYRTQEQTRHCIMLWLNKQIDDADNNNNNNNNNNI